jgi:hypothetical protein
MVHTSALKFCNIVSQPLGRVLLGARNIQLVRKGDEVSEPFRVYEGNIHNCKNALSGKIEACSGTELDKMNGRIKCNILYNYHNSGHYPCPVFYLKLNSTL